MALGWPGFTSTRTSVAARLGLLAMCVVIAAFQTPLSLAVLPAVLLAPISVVSLLPLPRRVPRWVLTAGEALVEATLLGALGRPGTYYAPYLLVAVALTGFLSPILVALATAALTSAALLAAAAAAQPGHSPQAMGGFANWAPVLVSVAFLAASVRRVRDAGTLRMDPAYLDAHRLLTELHVVSRQLSLGLDPPTLARALLDGVREQIPVLDAAVLVRTERGGFVPLAGADPGTGAAAVHDAWVTAEPVVRAAPGETSDLTIPVRMGMRVVAVVWLRIPREENPLSRVRDLRAQVAEAGPRLASALRFDDVRRLATVDERNRVAREIHDGIAQDLASLGYLVDDIRSDADPPTADRLTTVVDQVRTLISEIRLRIFDLRASVDDATGLGAAVTEYVQRVASQSGLAVSVALKEGEDRLPTAVEIELLRILQEAVTNVRRHARASTLRVDLTVDVPHARLVVVDDGRGLRPGRVDSMGITGMRERATRIGAELRITPADPGGTRIEVVLGRESRGFVQRVDVSSLSREMLVSTRSGPPGEGPGQEATQ